MQRRLRVAVYGWLELSRLPLCYVLPRTWMLGYSWFSRHGSNTNLRSSSWDSPYVLMVIISRLNLVEQCQAVEFQGALKGDIVIEVLFGHRGLRCSGGLGGF